MKFPNALPIALWIAVLAGFAAAAVPDEFGRRLLVAEELHRQGAYAEAEKQLLALLTEADIAGSGGILEMAVLNNLGSVYHSMYLHSKAEQCYRRAIQIEKAAGTAANGRCVRSTVNLACLYIDMGQYPKAERLGLRSLAESWPISRRYDADFGRLLTTLGTLEFRQGRPATAERFELEALEIWEKLTPNGVELIEVLNNLGVFYLAVRRNAEALASFERALTIAAGTLPADDPAQVTLLVNAGRFHAVVDGLAAAEPFYRKALSIAQEKLGGEHPVVGEILSAYGVLLEKTGRKAQAMQYRRRAQSIRNVFGKTDPRSYTVDVHDLPRRK